jgi:hypothetical protein
MPHKTTIFFEIGGFDEIFWLLKQSENKVKYEQRWPQPKTFSVSTCSVIELMRNFATL